MFKIEERQFLYFYASFCVCSLLGEIVCQRLTMTDLFKDFCLCLYTKAWRIHFSTTGTSKRDTDLFRRSRMYNQCIMIDVTLLKNAIKIDLLIYRCSITLLHHMFPPQICYKSTSNLWAPQIEMIHYSEISWDDKFGADAEIPHGCENSAAHLLTCQDSYMYSSTASASIKTLYFQ